MQILSPTQSCCFIWLIVSFAVQKFFGLMRSHLFDLASVVCAFCITPKTPWEQAARTWHPDHRECCIISPKPIFLTSSEHRTDTHVFSEAEQTASISWGAWCSLNGSPFAGPQGGQLLRQRRHVQLPGHDRLPRNPAHTTLALSHLLNLPLQDHSPQPVSSSDQPGHKPKVCTYHLHLLNWVGKVSQSISEVWLGTQWEQESRPSSTSPC